MVYLVFFKKLYTNLKNTSNLNINLFQTTLWTTELISIFVSFRTLYERDVINALQNPSEKSFVFNDYLTEDGSGLGSKLYYQTCINFCFTLYDKLSKSYGSIEMEIPKYLSDEKLMELYWNRINISYMNETYMDYSGGKRDDESFPMAMNQLLSNSITYFESNIFNGLDEDKIKTFNSSFDSNKMYFEYMTHLIIENGYDNILPNQFNKLMKIPDILTKYNSHKTSSIKTLICLYGVIIVILCLLFCFLIHLTNKSMTDGIEKVTKIRLEKIEEIIKRIKTFNSNLKKFRERDLKSEDNKEEGEDENKNLEGSKIIDSNGERTKKKWIKNLH